ncbi:MAG: hypothetical protein AB1716_07560, partial [Planctomycetota bacterium]
MKRVAVLVTWCLILATAEALAQGKSPPGRGAPTGAPQESAARQTAARSLRVDPAHWAPAEALFYVGITDVGETYQAVKRTAEYKNRAEGDSKDPGMQVLTELPKRLAKMFGVTADELKNPFIGPAMFYLDVEAGENGTELRMGVVAGVGDMETMRHYYDAAVTKLKSAGRHEQIAADKYNIDLFTLEKVEEAKPADTPDTEAPAMEDEAGEPGGRGSPPVPSFGPQFAMPDASKMLDQVLKADALPRQFAMCLTEDRIILDSSVERVKAILQEEKPASPLADTDHYRKLLVRCRPVGTVRFMLNLPRIIETVQAAQKNATPEDGASAAAGWQKQVEGLGPIVGHARLGAASCDMQMDMLLMLDKQGGDVAKLLAMENRPTAPPASISADTSFYVGLNVNPQQLVEQVVKLAAGEEQAQQLQVGLQQAPLDALRGPVTLEVGLTSGKNPLRALAAVGHTDQARVAAFLAQQAAGAPGMLVAREVGGVQAYDLKLPPPLPDGISVAASKDRLIVGTSASVDTAIEAPAQTLAETDGWRLAARMVPDQSWFTFYMDSRRLMKGLLDLANNP